MAVEGQKGRGEVGWYKFQFLRSREKEHTKYSMETTRHSSGISQYAKRLHSKVVSSNIYNKQLMAMFSSPDIRCFNLNIIRFGLVREDEEGQGEDKI